MTYYVDDFETTSDEKDCRVWLWSSVECMWGSVETGTDIDSYFDYVISHPGIHFFHNLKFDGNFLVWQLLKDDFQWVKWDWENVKSLKKTQFSTIISSDNLWYSIAMKTYSGKLVQFFDSSKIVPSKVTKSYRIDYDAQRPKGYKPTDEEISYCINDCMWVREKLLPFIRSDIIKITAGTIALSTYKNNFIGSKKFRYFFPVIPKEYDADIRRAYTGGWNWLNAKHQNKILGPGLTLDVNSIYDYCLVRFACPFGDAVRFDGEYQANSKYNLWLQDITFDAELREGFLPSIILPDKLVPQFGTRYLETTFKVDSDGLGYYSSVNLLLSNVDLEELFKRYEVFNVRYNGGWMFASTTGLFDDYVGYWYQQKSHLPKDTPERAVAKLMLVSLIGKFGAKPQTKVRKPYLKNEIVKTKVLEEWEERKSVYLPVAVFVNAYARRYILQSADKVQDRLIYCDVDSLHITGETVPDGIPVSGKIGNFKIEKQFLRAKYLKTKCYAQEFAEPQKSFCFLKNYMDPWRNYVITDVVAAGVPAELHRQIGLHNFREGKRLYGKLEPVSVKGGVVLQNKSQVI